MKFYSTFRAIFYTVSFVFLINILDKIPESGMPIVYTVIIVFFAILLGKKKIDTPLMGVGTLFALMVLGMIFPVLGSVIFVLVQWGIILWLVVKVLIMKVIIGERV